MLNSWSPLRRKRVPKYALNSHAVLADNSQHFASISSREYGVSWGLDSVVPAVYNNAEDGTWHSTFVPSELPRVTHPFSS